MLYKVRYLLFVVLSIFAIALIAQPLLQRDLFRMNHLSVLDGLDNMRVFSILQGKEGEMWISTRNGINRYNGSTMQNYHLDSDEKVSNAAGRIISLCQAKNGLLMAYDNKGNLYQFDNAKGRFVSYYQLHTALEGDIKLNTVFYDGNYWLALRRGVYCLKNNRVHKVFGKDESNCFTRIGNTIASGLNHGVLLINSGASASYLRGSEKFNVQSIFYDSATGYLWVGTLTDGVRVFDVKAKQWKDTPQLRNIPVNPIRSFALYDATTLLVGVDGGGVYRVDRHLQASSLFLNAEDETSNALTGNGIYTICVDKDRNIWVGSYTGGVDVAYPSVIDVRIFKHEYNNPATLIANNVNDICETADGTLWFATDIGLSIYHPSTGSWHHTMRNEVVVTLCADGASSVYAGTYGKGVLRVNSNGASSIAFPGLKSDIKPNYISSLYKDKEGDLWIGNIEKQLICIHNGQPVSYPAHEVECLTSMPNGNILVGCTNGFNIINKQTGKMVHYFSDKEFPGQDINLFITSIVPLNNEKVWLGTDGGGVYLYDVKKRRILRSLSTANRLRSNSISALLRDKEGRLFISSDKGVSVLASEQAKETRNLSLVKGIEQEYNRMSCASLRDGRIAFGGNNGAVVVNTSQLENLHYKASLRFVRLTPTLTNGEELDDKTIEKLHAMLSNGSVNLAYSQNTFGISFECINYRFQHDIEYRYQLEGFDNQWLSMRELHGLRYTNLPPGNYVLHVRAQSKTDGHILDSKDLEISVSNPWYLTPFARFLYFLVFVSLIWLSWRTYNNRLEKRYYNEKINFFINTAHDIRTPLSLVLAPLNDIAEDEKLSERSRGFLNMARRNGEKLMKMISQLLDFQKFDTSRMQLSIQQVNLSEFLEKEVGRFIPLAQQKSLKLTLNSCPEKDTWIDSSMVEIILDNLISNAIKYTPEGGSVSVYAEEMDGKVSISVKDTGIGIPKKDLKKIFGLFFRAGNAVNGPSKGSGLGLMISRKMAERMGAELRFVSEEGKGTTFTLGPLSTLLKEELISKSEKQDDHKDVSSDAKSENSVDKVRETLLFVDDNEELRNYIHMAYDGYYDITSVESGEKALEFLKQGGLCDIIVSDVMMPGMQGDELCRHIKENSDTSWIPVILLTAKSGKDFMINGLNLGADDYITKPFDPQILRSKIDSMLSNRRRLSRYYLAKALSMAGKENLPEDQLPELEENSADNEFIDKATHIVLENLSDETFDINALCREMAMSRTLFYGRLKTLTGQTPQEFIRLIRLEQASSLLKQGIPVLDVATRTGFSNSKYFSTLFKKHFGISPSQVKA